jgi:REP element-mobilizing transposase RayT
MAAREIFSTGIYHIYNRGTLAMNIFHEGRDYDKFLSKLYEYKLKFNVNVLVYCLMPSHFHLLLKEPEMRTVESIANISYMMKVLLNSYAKYFICKYKHSGNVFQGNFKSKFVGTDEYFFQLKEYILNNPVRSGLVKERNAWKYLGYDNKAFLTDNGSLTDLPPDKSCRSTGLTYVLSP